MNGRNSRYIEHALRVVVTNILKLRCPPRDFDRLVVSVIRQTEEYVSQHYSKVGKEHTDPLSNACPEVARSGTQHGEGKRKNKGVTGRPDQPSSPSQLQDRPSALIAWGEERRQ